MHQFAIFGGGCFWCLEAIFQRVPGVISVTSGYAGGDTADPDYRSVCSGTTGHAEVVRIEYDPQQTGYDQLLDLFFHAHDPTTLNRQGADHGTQYRSIIIAANPQQKQNASRYIEKLRQNGIRVVTEVTDPLPFYPAEPFHQNYYDQNTDQPYCRAVILPKLQKLAMENR